MDLDSGSFDSRYQKVLISIHMLPPSLHFSKPIQPISPLPSHISSLHSPFLHQPEPYPFPPYRPFSPGSPVPKPKYSSVFFPSAYSSGHTLSDHGTLNQHLISRSNPALLLPCAPWASLSRKFGLSSL
ncbi:hypothetical protein K469DRAFT_374016 [Zopfia rhizophila CBS 207.26]|uniref:Uncharacterized protein n=1 Tax=Zopfia rhizophila CBS 207.26 TaxID=1314779 RepID=A0A6A6EKA2_9PEZI|nr:hypothetical protein K469DRAFT_374016 [Zopfia rhizophila CBS 207.26]